MTATDPAPRLATVPLGDLSATDKDAIVRVCTAAHGHDFGSLFGFLVDTTHVLGYHGDDLVAHACFGARWLEPAGVGRLTAAFVDAVAVAPEVQGKGVGSRLMRHLAAAIAGHDLGALGTERISFYQRLGWEPWTGPMSGLPDDPTDTVMVLRTPLTPPLDPTAPLVAQPR